MMRELVIASLLVSSVAWGAPGAAEVERVLGGYEHAPTADDVKRLGAGADQTLIAAAEDPRTSAIRRVRAIGALRFVPSAAAHEYLRALVEDKRRATAGADVLELAAALAALAPYGAGELPLELGFVAHASADVRQSAAAALGLIGDQSALGALRARLTVERDAGVRAALGRAVRALESPR